MIKKQRCIEITLENITTQRDKSRKNEENLHFHEVLHWFLHTNVVLVFYEPPPFDWDSCVFQNSTMTKQSP